MFLLLCLLFSIFLNISLTAASTGLSTHVLDISLGKPGEKVLVQTYRFENDKWNFIGNSETDSNGRINSALVLENEETTFKAGTYKLRFETGKYYEKLGIDTFYPHVEVVFKVDDSTKHLHVPLTLSPFGYSTYKGQ